MPSDLFRMILQLQVMIQEPFGNQMRPSDGGSDRDHICPSFYHGVDVFQFPDSSFRVDRQGEIGFQLPNQFCIWAFNRLD